MTSEHAEHDIVVAGGGLAGGSLALGLARQGWRVAMIEAVERSANHQPSYDDRTLALNAVSLNILENLGVVDQRFALAPIRAIEITRAGGFGRLTLAATDHGVARFGAVGVARELGNRLLNCLASQPNLTEYCPDRLAAFRLEGDGVRARLSSGRVLTGRLLVAADGTESAVRQAAGIVSSRHDYRQSAMVFNVRAAGMPPDTAFERFTADGPLALLPQPANRLGVVWIDQTEAVENALEWSDEQLLARLEARAGRGFDAFSSPGRRARYPLKLLRTEIPVTERVVAVGNAANTVHPVSAQGFNLGLRDVAGLLDALEGQADPGAPALLENYLRLRRRDQAETVRYTDTLARTFTNPSFLFRFGGAVGLAAHALLPGLQRRLVRTAMGYRMPISTLARPRPR